MAEEPEFDEDEVIFATLSWNELKSELISNLDHKYEDSITGMIEIVDDEYFDSYLPLIASLSEFEENVREDDDLLNLAIDISGSVTALIDSHHAAIDSKLEDLRKVVLTVTKKYLIRLVRELPYNNPYVEVIYDDGNFIFKEKISSFVDALDSHRLQDEGSYRFDRVSEQGWLGIYEFPFSGDAGKWLEKNDPNSVFEKIEKKIKDVLIRSIQSFDPLPKNQLSFDFGDDQ